MKRLLAPTAAAALAALLLAPAARPAYACSCAALSAQQLVDGAAVIAVGKVIDVGDADYDVDPLVLVERYLKGAGPTQIAVDDPVWSGDCGLFDSGSLGRHYLLFLRGDQTPLQTDICSGTTELTGGAPDQLLLEAVVAITGRGSPPQEGGVPWPTIALASALGGVALILVASAFLRRRRIMGRNP